MPNKFRLIQKICEEVPEPEKEGQGDFELAKAQGKYDLAQKILKEVYAHNTSN